MIGVTTAVASPACHASSHVAKEDSLNHLYLRLTKQQICLTQHPLSPPPILLHII